MTEEKKAVKLSRVVYYNVLEYYKKLGYTQVQECKNGNDYAVVCSNDNEVAVVFRGSDDVKDWFDNMDLFVDYYKGYGKLHGGFSESYFGQKNRTKKKWKVGKWGIPKRVEVKLPDILGLKDSVAHAIKNSYSKGKKLLICGHSRGGAFAELCAYDNRDKSPILYTFGSPRVGKGEWRRRFRSSDITYKRYVNGKDPVPRLPRAWRGNRHVVDPVKLKDGWFGILWYGDFKDHFISRYDKNIT